MARACRIHPENFSVIASKKPDFDLEFTKRWLDEHEQGYFIRDSSSPFDRQYMEASVFFEMYRVVGGTNEDIFRPIEKR